jgi:hypothetical protein
VGPVQQANLLYWIASHAPAPLLLRQFSQTIWHQNHPDDVVLASFSFDHWTSAFEQVACLVGNRRIILYRRPRKEVRTDPKQRNKPTRM